MSSSETSILGDLPPLEEVQYLEVPKLELSDQAGNVLVAIDYKVQTKTLVLTVESAHDLPVEMFGGPGSRTTVAVKIELNINQRERAEEKLGVLTEGRRFTANPVFNSSFEHHLEPRDIENASLHLSMIIWGKYAPKKTIAETTLHLGSVDTGKKCRASLALSPVEMRSAGEVLVSLCYLPTSARFIVGIMNATGLESRRGDGCDPCVRITILIGGKRLWKRKTAIHVNQRNPVFEEMFVFDVPQEKLDKVKFLIMVTDERETVLSPVGEAPENEIGRVVLGRGCSLEANIHWSEIRKQPRRPIAQWYSLY